MLCKKVCNHCARRRPANQDQAKQALIPVIIIQLARAGEIPMLYTVMSFLDLVFSRTALAGLSFKASRTRIVRLHERRNLLYVVHTPLNQYTVLF